MLCRTNLIRQDDDDDGHGHPLDDTASGPLCSVPSSARSHHRLEAFGLKDWCIVMQCDAMRWVCFHAPLDCGRGHLDVQGTPPRSLPGIYLPTHSALPLTQGWIGLDWIRSGTLAMLTLSFSLSRFRRVSAVMMITMLLLMMMR